MKKSTNTSRLTGETTRMPRLDGTDCEICTVFAPECYFKEVYTGHKLCLEKAKINRKKISENIVRINSKSKIKAA